MTDRELLELAEKAAGYDYITETEGDVFAWKSCDCIEWNPLTNDGDALRLAVKLNLGIVFNFEFSEIAVVTSGDSEWVYREKYASDPYAATRRAIVRAAAEIGKEMKP